MIRQKTTRDASAGSTSTVLEPTCHYLFHRDGHVIIIVSAIGDSVDFGSSQLFWIIEHVLWKVRAWLGVLVMFDWRNCPS